jgi:hypothetical protein
MLCRVLAVLFILPLASALPFLKSCSYRDVTDKAVNYLAINYNGSVGLIPEFVNSSTFWIYSDNFLSATVLLYYDENNSTLTQIGNAINSRIAYYLSKYNIKPYSLYNVLGDGGFIAYNNTLTFTLEDSVKIDLNNGTTPLNPSEYGDVAFLQSLYYYRIGDIERALDYFNVGALMYDGVGINDKAFREGDSRGIYQTYKLALFHLAGYVLGCNTPNSVVNRILSLQTSSGGFLTGYYPNGTIPSGVTANTETTALVIYALSPQIIEKFFPKHASSKPPTLDIINILLLLTAIILVLGGMVKILGKALKSQADKNPAKYSCKLLYKFR